ncbi:MAG: hypothetical protein ACUVVU_00720 [Tepidimonas sp.]|uniref:hypothetical protein n=1 Tax=Tepidimonas sp. TaxID=2002775 RepID=UPI004055146D
MSTAPTGDSDDTAVRHCAGAALPDPDGACNGMLDLTGVMVPDQRARYRLASVTAAASKKR